MSENQENRQPRHILPAIFVLSIINEDFSILFNREMASLLNACIDDHKDYCRTNNEAFSPTLSKLQVALNGNDKYVDGGGDFAVTRFRYSTTLQFSVDVANLILDTIDSHEDRLTYLESPIYELANKIWHQLDNISRRQKFAASDNSSSAA